jgi:hypothetical protein
VIRHKAPTPRCGNRNEDQCRRDLDSGAYEKRRQKQDAAEEAKDQHEPQEQEPKHTSTYERLPLLTSACFDEFRSSDARRAARRLTHMHPRNTHVKEIGRLLFRAEGISIEVADRAAWRRGQRVGNAGGTASGRSEARSEWELQLTRRAQRQETGRLYGPSSTEPEATPECQSVGPIIDIVFDVAFFVAGMALVAFVLWRQPKMRPRQRDAEQPYAQSPFGC